MIIIDKLSRTPVYEQLINRIEELIVSGALPPDAQIPSVRVLAVELTVNPNTVQKAYTSLEDAGVTYSVAGVGRFVSKNAREIIARRASTKLTDFRELITRLRMNGVSKDVLIEVINDEFSKGGKL